eukprot:5189021-Amphidinium_carterae.1
MIDSTALQDMRDGPYNTNRNMYQFKWWKQHCHDVNNSGFCLEGTELIKAAFGTALSLKDSHHRYGTTLPSQNQLQSRKSQVQ